MRQPMRYHAPDAPYFLTLFFTRGTEWGHLLSQCEGQVGMFGDNTTTGGLRTHPTCDDTTEETRHWIANSGLDNYRAQ